MTEDEARGLVRAAARRVWLVVLVTVLLVFVAYVLVQQALFDRALGPALLNAAGLLLLVALMQIFFFTPAWARRPSGPIVAARVARVDRTGRGHDSVLLRGPGAGAGAQVRVDLPRDVSGLTRGDTVRVTPALEPGTTIAVVLPAHVTSGRRVLSLEASAP